MYNTAMSEDEKRWQRRDDARTLARAEEIRADKERLNQAHIGAKEILAEEAERLKGLSKIASNPTVDKAVQKGERIKKENPVSPLPTKTVNPVRTSRYPNPATIGKLF